MRRNRTRLFTFILGSFAVLALFATHAIAQSASHPDKPTPLEIVPDLWVLDEGVVSVQWPATLDLVNAPSNLKQVEPGQCIHFAVIATGDGRDTVLQSAKYGFEIDYDGKTQTIAPESPAALKRIKPEGGDFVTGALAAAGIKNPVSSMASMAASQAKWCMPADAKDGKLVVRATVIQADGKQVALKPRTFDLVTFETARKTPPFTSTQEMSSWLQKYYAAPDAAEILPALRLAVADKKVLSSLDIMQFLISAVKQSPTAAKELSLRLVAEAPEVRVYGLSVLLQSGFPIDDLLQGLDDKTKATLLAYRVPDAFDQTPDEMLSSRMDMLWAIFFATGDIGPVRTLASMLAWKEDYLKLKQIIEAAKKNPGQKTEPTASIYRGADYMAAGWSLNALSRQNGLVTDYIEVFLASPDFSAVAKQGLSELATNPDFRQSH